MIPRTVQMAKEVASQLTPTQLDSLGNIILNGYATTGANTTGKLAWQYKETTTAPVPLPSVTSVQPMLRGWTTNYQEYYTNLQPNGYGVNPGDPTMFAYSVQSFAPQRGPIKTVGWISGGSGYTLGTYTNVPLTGAGGSGARADIVVTPTPGVVGGPVTGVTLTNPGSGYPGMTAFSGVGTTNVTGNGVGLMLNGTTNVFGNLVSVMVDPGFEGNGYQTGDVVRFGGGNGLVTVASVSITGSVTSFTLTSPGNNYIVGQAVTASIPGGTGFAAPITAVNPLPNRGGMVRWAQPPRRFSQNQVADFVPPGPNQQAIPYSFIYPVPNNPEEPPIGWLLNPPPAPISNGGGTVNGGGGGGSSGGTAA